MTYRNVLPEHSYIRMPYRTYVRLPAAEPELPAGPEPEAGLDKDVEKMHA